VNRKRLIVIAILLIVLGCIIGVRNIPQDESMDNTELLETLEIGDILFVDIYDGWCLWGYWDHLGVYVGDQAFGGFYKEGAVIEATYDGGIISTTVDAFYNRDLPANVYIKRLKDVPDREKIIESAVQYALDQIGGEFEPFILPPNKLEDKKHHCSEIVWRAYKSAGTDLDSDGGFMLLPDDIYYSSWLESI
jgi:uncharacterized protein YycO